MRKTPERDEGRAGRVALVGRPNVGKSTLLNAMVGERLAITSHHPQTTRDRIVGVVTEPRAQFVLVDTPGLHAPRTRLGTRMVKEAQGALLGSEVVVFVTDVGREPRPEVHALDRPLLASLPAENVVLAVNKVDRVKDKSLLLPLLEAYSKERPFSAIVPLSARKGDGTRPLLDAVRDLLPKGEPLYEKDTLTDKPARFLAAEIVREQILDKTRDEVPHGVAVVVEGWDESGKTIKIDVAIVVDKESHKKIVIGKDGSLLKAMGTVARRRISEMLGRKVHLSIFVRAMPRWYESDRRLVELGYGESA